MRNKNQMSAQRRNEGDEASGSPSPDGETPAVVWWLIALAAWVAAVRMLSSDGWFSWAVAAAIPFIVIWFGLPRSAQDRQHDSVRARSAPVVMAIIAPAFASMFKGIPGLENAHSVAPFVIGAVILAAAYAWASDRKSPGLPRFVVATFALTAHIVGNAAALNEHFATLHEHEYATVEGMHTVAHRRDRGFDKFLLVGGTVRINALKLKVHAMFDRVRVNDKACLLEYSGGLGVSLIDVKEAGACEQPPYRPVRPWR